MNKRNFQIFGPTKKTKVITILLALVILLTLAWLWIVSKSPTAAVIQERPNLLTGAIFQQQQEEQQQQQEGGQQEQLERTEEQQEKKYHEYSEQCAFDIKQRQDDIADITNRRDSYQKELDKLTADYEQKKKALEEEYLTPSVRLKANIDETTEDLQEAEKSYNEAKTECNIQQP